MNTRYFLTLLAISFIVPACGSNNAEPVEPTKITVGSRVVFPDEVDLSNIMLQWCWEGGCSMLYRVDNTGYAEMETDRRSSYSVHVFYYDESTYTYDVTNSIIYPENPYKQIDMIKLNTPIDGEGISESPYTISIGYYNVSLTNYDSEAFYSFTAENNGKYQIYSVSSSIDTKIHDYTNNAEDDNSGLDNNFSYEFDAISGVTYTFGMTASFYEFYPLTYAFCLKLKA